MTHPLIHNWSLIIPPTHPRYSLLWNRLMRSPLISRYLRLRLLRPGRL